MSTWHLTWVPNLFAIIAHGWFWLDICCHMTFKIGVPFQGLSIPSWGFPEAVQESPCHQATGFSIRISWDLCCLSKLFGSKEGGPRLARSETSLQGRRKQRWQEDESAETTGKMARTAWPWLREWSKCLGNVSKNPILSPALSLSSLPPPLPLPPLSLPLSLPRSLPHSLPLSLSSSISLFLSLSLFPSPFVPSSSPVFCPQKRPKALGYPEGQHILHNKYPVLDFVMSDDHMALLGVANELVFDSTSRVFNRHPLTTDEIKHSCEDIKVSKIRRK